jgi:uracil-DNA glycosylase
MSGELDQIAKEVNTCTKCPLHKTRTKAVPGEGSPTAKLLFIGEAPGYHEDNQGRPFVGQSGQLLGHLLKAIKLEREDVFITNVVKCRPPQNRDPSPAEIEACKPYLDRQIAVMDPRVIVTLGRFSMARWFAGQRISQAHGKPKTEGGRIIMPMFHPAAALRDNSGPTMKAFKEDGLTIPVLLKEAEEMAATQLWGSISEVAMKPQEEIKAALAVDSALPEVAETVATEITAPSVEVEAKPKETKETAKRKKTAPTPTIVAEAKAEYLAENPVQELPSAQEVETDKKKTAKPARKKKPSEKPEAEQLSLF